PPLQAALEGSRQIAFTIVSLTLSLIAVLIPLLFMREVVGRLFREFAITLAVAILISAVVSLTLTPMMCARLLRDRPGDRPPGPDAPRDGPGAAGGWFDRLVARSGRRLRGRLGRPAGTLLVPVGPLARTGVVCGRFPKGSLPAPGTG